jgi:hypothetical protein
LKETPLQPDLGAQPLGTPQKRFGGYAENAGGLIIPLSPATDFIDFQKDQGNDIDKQLTNRI